MKKKILVILICMLLIASALPAVGTINKIEEREMPSFYQSGVEWEYTYGGDEFDWLYHVQPTSDGGYVAAGLTEEDNMYYGWLLKVNADGEEEWSLVEHNINGSVIDDEILVMCVRETTEPYDGYVVGGFSRYYDEINEWWATVGWLWMVNDSGETMGGAIIGDADVPYTMFPFNVLVVDDGYILGGLYIGGHEPDWFADIGLAKTDFEGNVEWIYNYDHDGSNMEYTRTLWKCNDGGYFLAGTMEDQSDLGNALMMKVDRDGKENWSSTFDGPATEYFPTIGGRQTDDGGYIVSGITYSYGAGGSDMWVIKTDADGNMDWNKTYGGTTNERNYGMDGTVDGDYVFVIIKNAYYPVGTKEDTWILTTDSEGNPEWELIIEEEGTQWGQAIEQTDDKGFIVSGRTGPIGNPGSDGLLLKVGPFPQLDFDLKGGFGVKAKITNNGEGNAVGAPYEITVKGGILGMINKTVNGTIDIEVGATETIPIGLIFGFGPFSVKITVGVKEEIRKGFNVFAFSLV